MSAQANDCAIDGIGSLLKDMKSELDSFETAVRCNGDLLVLFLNRLSLVADSVELKIDIKEIKGNFA
ncbi:MAG: hypothetical protein ABJN26_15010 [Stappiaceae bacterium]